MNDCYVAAATGCLKGLSLIDHTFLNLNSVKDLQPKQDEISRMIFGSPDQNQLLYSTASRQIRTFDTSTCHREDLYTVPGTGKINGLYLTPTDQIVTACETGSILVADRKGTELATMNGGPGLLCMNGCGDRIAAGGKDCPVKVFNLEKPEKPTWISKNVPPDELQLAIKIWDKDVRLMPNTETLITGTGTKTLRLYDMRTQRRPVMQLKWMESPINAISLSNQDKQIYAGNTHGELGLFDWRGTRIMLVCKYKGQAGAIRSIYGHPTLPYVASCGIDRFTRIHDSTTRKLVSKVYCKTRLNAVLMRDELSIRKTAKKEQEEIEEEWAQINQKEPKTEADSDGDESDDSEAWGAIDEESESGGEDEESDDDEEGDDSEDEDDEEAADEEEESDEEEASPPLKKKRVSARGDAGKAKPAATKPAKVKEEAESDDDDEDDDVQVISPIKAGGKAKGKRRK
ncbi:unnamed protein product, partial [Mesorhabditis spiculigera]